MGIWAAHWHSRCRSTAIAGEQLLGAVLLCWSTTRRRVGTSGHPSIIACLFWSVYIGMWFPGMRQHTTWINTQHGSTCFAEA